MFHDNAYFSIRNLSTNFLERRVDDGGHELSLVESAFACCGVICKTAFVFSDVGRPSIYLARVKHSMGGVGEVNDKRFISHIMK